MILVIVKGTAAQVVAAARERRVYLSNVDYRVMFGECYAYVSLVQAHRVVAWFCEPAGPTPYPAGTLLFYREG